MLKKRKKLVERVSYDFQGEGKTVGSVPAEDNPTRAAALAALRRAQLPMPARPTHQGQPLHPQLPPDITTASASDIGRLHAQFAAMAAYAGACVALAAVDLVDKQRALRRVKAEAHLREKGHKTQDERRAMVELTAEVDHLTRLECEAEATRDLMQALYDGYITRKEACSREMTRRIDLQDKEPR